MIFKLKTGISLALISLFINVSLWAQQNPAELKDTVAGKKFFNALDYSMQKRYRPQGATFANNKWSDNTFLQFNIGVEEFVNRDKAEMGLYKLFSLGYGKMFTSVHGARLDINGGWALHNRTTDSYKRIGLQASYLFNLTSYLKGYDPSRLFELSTLLGLGYTYSKMDDKSTFNVAEIHAGLQLKLKLIKSLNLTLEPTIALYSDGIDHYTKTNWHKYDVGYGAKIGLLYDINRSSATNKNSDPYQGDSFVSVAGGVQYQYSDIVKELGIFNSLGPHIALSLGKWLHPCYAVRGSLFYGSNIWNSHYIYNDDHEVIDSKNLKSSYIGTRIEGMVNILEFTNLDVKKYLSLSALAGLEVGAMNKRDITQNVKFAYFGFTTALQAKYKVNSKWGVFFEPRLSIVPYSHVLINEEGTALMDRQKYSDNIYNFNIGVEYSF